MKVKKQPKIKNGANGIKRCLCARPHHAPIMQDIINAMDKPVVPNHSPPTPINLMSPMPIGVSYDCARRLEMYSYANPIKQDTKYPKAAPITPDSISVGI